MGSSQDDWEGLPSPLARSRIENFYSAKYVRKMRTTGGGGGPETRESSVHPTCAARPFPAERSRRSLLGRLDSLLPAELIIMVLEQLDFRSLSRLARTCIRGNAVVESLPCYWDVMRHAPEVLADMARTDLLRLHSVTMLWRALRSSECVSCRQRGVLLFMPTCERACLACLGINPALRMMRVRDAKRRFELDDGQVRSLNVMKSIPWQYETEGPVLYQPYIRLVNEEQARQLGLRVHASRDRDRLRNKEVLFIAIGP
ncbi:hypothetical protein N3K66_003603 [Trichothecium roseum]|uniref:Uncharacterized protein n=1 Tax=Trichothecium roseum TaxID=47278 RepID=A0ACC0V5W2_9HYPO|nr:hypothetical protein N3K66_003603 [Trichothecium roseum]